MKKPLPPYIFFLIILFIGSLLIARVSFCQDRNDIKAQILISTKKALKFADENLSCNGGYVWTYKTDLTRRWGELEAYPSMVWVQGPGTVAMGNLFLELFEFTSDEYYYQLAGKAGDALIKGQLPCGGWNYFINFDDELSTKNWYNTIGRNAWRLEEFHHYYGNATFDDNSTTGAADYLLKLWLTRRDSIYKIGFDKALKFIIESQNANGGWPQRFPQTDSYSHKGLPDYTGCPTFNDGVTLDNTFFLIKCRELLQNEKLNSSIEKAMNFFLLSQQANPQAGWAMQYTNDLKPAPARTYEPASLEPRYTVTNIKALMFFYELTGDKKFLERIPDAFSWLESVIISRNGKNIVTPTFVEIGTNKALYLHRKGSNINFGEYYFDYENEKLVSHYPSFRNIEFDDVKEKFVSLSNADENEILKKIKTMRECTRNLSPLEFFKYFNERFDFEERNRQSNFLLEERHVKNILNSQNENGMWTTTRVFVSYPYIEAAPSGNPESEEYITTRVGDKYDTSPFENTSGEEFISTSQIIRNIKLMMEYLQKN